MVIISGVPIFRIFTVNPKDMQEKVSIKFIRLSLSDANSDPQFGVFHQHPTHWRSLSHLQVLILVFAA